MCVWVWVEKFQAKQPMEKWGGASYTWFRSRSSLFRRDDVSENRLRSCLLPGREVEGLQELEELEPSQTMRVG